MRAVMRSKMSLRRSVLAWGGLVARHCSCFGRGRGLRTSLSMGMGLGGRGMLGGGGGGGGGPAGTVVAMGLLDIFDWGGWVMWSWFGCVVWCGLGTLMVDEFGGWRGEARSEM